MKIKDNHHQFSSSPSSSSRSSYSGGAASWTWPSLRTKLLVSRSPIGTWVTFFDNFSKRNMLYHPGLWHNSWICARKRWLPRSRRSRQGVQHRPPGKQSHPWQRGFAFDSFLSLQSSPSSTGRRVLRHNPRLLSKDPNLWRPWLLPESWSRPRRCHLRWLLRPRVEYLTSLQPLIWPNRSQSAKELSFIQCSTLSLLVWLFWLIYFIYLSATLPNSVLIVGIPNSDPISVGIFYGTRVRSWLPLSVTN